VQREERRERHQFEEERDRIVERDAQRVIVRRFDADRGVVGLGRLSAAL
jgi:hypothetical protein